MGRKTNSISLRLKKTNKDYLSCIYGDLLYPQIFAKSLRIQKSLTSILSFLDISIPHISTISGFKKSNFLICYLEKSSKDKFSELFSLKKKKPLTKNIRENIHEEKEKTIKETVNKKYILPIKKSSQIKIEESRDILSLYRQKNIDFENIYLTKFYNNSTIFFAKKNYKVLALPNINPTLCHFRKKIYRQKIDYLPKEKNLLNSKKNTEIVQKKNLKIDCSIISIQKKSNFLISSLYHILFFGLVCGFKYDYQLYKKKPLSLSWSNWTISKTQSITEKTWLTFFIKKTYNQNCKDFPIFAKEILNQKPLSIFLEKKPENIFFSEKGQRYFNTIDKIKETQKKEYNFSGLGSYGFGPYGARPNNQLLTFCNLNNSLSAIWENIITVSFIKTSNEKANALFLASFVSYFLERKVSFRNIKRQLFLSSFSSIWSEKTKEQSFKNSNKFSVFSSLKSKIRGVRISCSGRVGGRSKKAQRSRKETFMWGETGLHVFSSKLDFALTHAETSFGLVGVKVWICYK